MAPEKYHAKRPQTGAKAAKNAGPSPKKPTSAEMKQREAEKRRQQAQARRAAREEMARQRRIRRQRRLRLLKISFLVSLVMVALYWVYVAVSISTRPDGSENALPLMIFTEGEREEDNTLEVSEVYFSGSYYLPLTELEPYMAISQFGDHKTRSFLLCGSEEYATFTLGTPEVEINGVKVSLKENSFVKNDVLYIPMDFFTDKMNCFAFTESVPLAANVLTFNESVTPGFRFQPVSGMTTVNQATVPVAPVLPADPIDPAAPTA